jgi:hypothetical protein
MKARTTGKILAFVGFVAVAFAFIALAETHLPVPF